MVHFLVRDEDRCSVRISENSRIPSFIVLTDRPVQEISTDRRTVLTKLAAESTSSNPSDRTITPPKQTTSPMSLRGLKLLESPRLHRS